MNEPPYSNSVVAHPIGRVVSPLHWTADAPRQGDEGGVSARIVIAGHYAAAAADLAVGDSLVIVTWLGRADRNTLAVHPRDDSRRPSTGVFSTRSAGRPNPIGLHEVTVTAVDGLTVTVEPLEAIDGTPVLDIKPVLGLPEQR